MEYPVSGGPVRSGLDSGCLTPRTPRRKGSDGFSLRHRGHGGGTEFTEWSPSSLRVLGLALGDLCDEIQFCFRIRDIREIRGCRIRSTCSENQFDHGWHGWARIGKTEKRLKGWPVIQTFPPWRLCAFARVLPGIDHLFSRKDAKAQRFGWVLFETQKTQRRHRVHGVVTIRSLCARIGPR